MRMTKASQVEKSEWLFVRDPGSDARMERIRTHEGAPWTYTVPAERDDGWKVAGLSDVGLDEGEVGVHDEIRRHLHVIGLQNANRFLALIPRQIRPVHFLNFINDTNVDCFVSIWFVLQIKEINHFINCR